MYNWEFRLYFAICILRDLTSRHTRALSLLISYLHLLATSVLIRVKKGFPLLAISGVVNDNVVHREKNGVSINGSLLLSIRGALEIGANYWWTLLFQHEVPVDIANLLQLCARVTLILAPCVLPCCKLLAAWARELASVHGNKSMRIATARRYARNLSDSLKFTRCFASLGQSSSINHPAIYFPRKERKKRTECEVISQRRGCRLVKFNASLNKARSSYIFLRSGRRGSVSATFIRENSAVGMRNFCH